MKRVVQVQGAYWTEQKQIKRRAMSSVGSVNWCHSLIGIICCTLPRADELGLDAAEHVPYHSALDLKLGWPPLPGRRNYLCALGRYWAMRHRPAPGSTPAGSQRPPPIGFV